MVSSFFSPLSFLPYAVFWALLTLAAFRYARLGQDGLSRPFSFFLFPFSSLAKSALWFRILYAVLLTAAQYYIWAQDPFARSFLSMPARAPGGVVTRMPWLFDTTFGYFLFYSWGRFWLGAVLSIGAALLFWSFLRVLRRKNQRFFIEGEPELGFLAALTVGWPNFVVFVPLLFIAVVGVSLVRLAVFREAYTTLGWPFLAAAAATLLWGPRLVDLFHLAALRV